jgi:hypothetical protein
MEVVLEVVEQAMDNVVVGVVVAVAVVADVHREVRFGCKDVCICWDAWMTMPVLEHGQEQSAVVAPFALGL